VDHQADEAADDGAVDPDALQVSTDERLHPRRGLHAFPPVDGVADDRGGAGAVAVDGEGRQISDVVVQPVARLMFGLCSSWAR
jgi:hypothetical protein